MVLLLAITHLSEAVQLSFPTFHRMLWLMGFRQLWQEIDGKAKNIYEMSAISFLRDRRGLDNHNPGLLIRGVGKSLKK